MSRQQRRNNAVGEDSVSNCGEAPLTPPSGASGLSSSGKFSVKKAFYPTGLQGATSLDDEKESYARRYRTDINMAVQVRFQTKRHKDCSNLFYSSQNPERHYGVTLRSDEEVLYVKYLVFAAVQYQRKQTTKGEFLHEFLMSKAPAAARSQMESPLDDCQPLGDADAAPVRCLPTVMVQALLRDVELVYQQASILEHKKRGGALSCRPFSRDTVAVSGGDIPSTKVPRNSAMKAVSVIPLWRVR